MNFSLVALGLLLSLADGAQSPRCPDAAQCRSGPEGNCVEITRDHPRDAATVPFGKSHAPLTACDENLIWLSWAGPRGDTCAASPGLFKRVVDASAVQGFFYRAC